MQQQSVETLPKQEQEWHDEATQYARQAKAKVDVAADRTAEQQQIAEELRRTRAGLAQRYKKAEDEVARGATNPQQRTSLDARNAEPFFKLYYRWLNTLNENAFSPTGSSEVFFRGLQQQGLLTQEQMIGILPVFETFILPGQEMRFSPGNGQNTPLEFILANLAARNPSTYQVMNQILEGVVQTDATAQQFGLGSKSDFDKKLQLFKEIARKIQLGSNQEEASKAKQNYDQTLKDIDRDIKARPGDAQQNINDLADVREYLFHGRERGAEVRHPDATDPLHDPAAFEQHIRDILASINMNADQVRELFQTAQLYRDQRRAMEEDPRYSNQARTESVRQLIDELNNIGQVSEILIENGQIKAGGEEELNERIEKSLLTLMQKAFDNPEKAFDENFNQLVEAADVSIVIEKLYRLGEKVTRADYVANLTPDVRARLRAILIESAKRTSALVDMARLMHNIPFVFRKAPEDKWAQYIGSVSVSKFASLTRDPATKEAMKYFNQFLYQVIVVENNNTIPPELFSEMFYDVGYGGAGTQVRYGNEFFDRFKSGLVKILDSSQTKIKYDDDKLNWLTHCVFLNFVTGDATRILANSKARDDWKAKPFARFLFAHKPGEHGINIGLEGGLELLKNRLHFVMKMPMSQLAKYDDAYGKDGWDPKAHREEVEEWVDHKISAEDPDGYADKVNKDIDNHWYRFWGTINKIGMWTYFDQGGFRLGGVVKEYELAHNGKKPSEDWNDFYDWCVRGDGPGITNGFYFAESIAKGQAKDLYIKSPKGEDDIKKAGSRKKAVITNAAEGGLYVDNAFDAAVDNVGNKPLKVRAMNKNGEFEEKSMCLEEFIMLRTRGVRAETMYMAMLKDPISFMSAITQMESELAEGSVNVGGRDVPASEFYFSDQPNLSPELKQKRNIFRAYAMINFRRENLPHLQKLAKVYEKAYGHTFIGQDATTSNGAKWARVSEILSVAQTRTRIELGIDGKPKSTGRYHMTRQDILGPNPTADEEFVADLMFGTDGMITHFSQLGGGQDLARIQRHFGDGEGNVGETNNFFTRWAQAHYEVNGLNFSPMLLDNDPDQMLRKLVVSGPNAIERQFEIYAEVPKILDDILKPYGYMKELADTGDIKGMMELITKKNKKMETIYDKSKMYINNFFNLYLLGQDFRLADICRTPILGTLNELHLSYGRSLASGDYQNLNTVKWTDDTLIALAQYFAVFSYIGKKGLWSAPMLLNAWGLEGKNIDEIRTKFIMDSVLPSAAAIGLAAYLYFAIRKAADEKDLDEKR